MLSGDRSTVRTPPPPEGPVRGRNRELALIEVALRESRPVLVRGDAGVGVSRVLAESVRRLGLRDVQVARPAVMPWSATPEALLASVTEALLAPHRVAVVLDDADLYDQRRLHDLRDECHRSTTALLVGAHADVPALSGDPSATVIDLPGLDRSAVADLVSVGLGERLPLASPLVSAFHRASDGNASRLRALIDDPALRSTLERARDLPDPSVVAVELSRALPARLHAAVLRLDEAGRLALAVVAVAVGRAPEELLVAAAGAEALQDGIEVGLLAPVPGGGTGFRHSAVRRLLLQEMPDALLAEARWRLAVAAQRQGITIAPAAALPGRSA